MKKIKLKMLLLIFAKQMQKENNDLKNRITNLENK